MFFNRRRQVKHGIAVGDIDHEIFHSATGRLNARLGLGQHVLAQICADDNGPLARHGLCAGRADTAAGTGDDAYFIFKVTHETPPRGHILAEAPIKSQ